MIFIKLLMGKFIFKHLVFMPHRPTRRRGQMRSMMVFVPSWDVACDELSRSIMVGVQHVITVMLSMTLLLCLFITAMLSML